MKVQIIKIGNSKGIRIPKSTLNDCGFEDTVEMQVKNNKLIISPAKKARDGWDKIFEKNTKKKVKDKVLEDFENLVDDWDDTEWTW